MARKTKRGYRKGGLGPRKILSKMFRSLTRIPKRDATIHLGEELGKSEAALGRTASQEKASMRSRSKTSKRTHSKKPSTAVAPSDISLTFDKI